MLRFTVRDNSVHYAMIFLLLLYYIRPCSVHEIQIKRIHLKPICFSCLEPVPTSGIEDIKTFQLPDKLVRCSSIRRNRAPLIQPPACVHY